jgi:SH3 domain-containing YSC84-like protein 1
MKQIGLLFGMLVLSAGMIFAQDNTSNAQSGNNGNSAQSTTTTTTNSQTTTSQTPSDQGSNSASDQNNNNDTHQTTVSERDQQQNQTRKQQAVHDDNAAAQMKDNAKNATSASGEEHDKAVARLDSAAADLNQLLAAPDNGIPDKVFTSAKCVAIVPDMIKGGFIFGAEHGRGVASCKLANGGWSAPAFFTMTGGNWGAQIGVEGVDLVMLIMNENGMNQLLSSKWKIGGNASASAGPVGRTAAADTNLKFNAEILTYSRSRGAYAGAVVNGAHIAPDENAMTGYYGSSSTNFRNVLTGKVHDPQGHNDKFLATLHRNRTEVNAEAH